MSQRLLNNTKWLCCFLVFSIGPTWSPVASVTVRTSLKTPATVEAQAKFFQDFFSVQLSPYKIEFGHVCEDPNTWEQRYEKKDFINHRDMGKVRWGDKKGGYGEHYWDLNHAGHADNHGHDDYEHGHDDDDGSYHVHDNEDPYDEPSEQAPNYTDEYDAEKAAKYEESNRAKRHHPKVKEVRENVEEVKSPRRKTKEPKTNEEAEPQKFKEEPQKYKEEPQKYKEEPQQYKKKLKRHKPREINYEEDQQEDFNVNAESGQFGSRFNQQQQLHQQQKQQQQQQQQQNQQQQQQQIQQQQKQQQQKQQQQKQQQQQQQQQDTRYVPYEDGAGVRHHQPEVTAAASSPRLFLEPSTGHVVDRATGQAYILQPIVANYN